MSENKFNFTKAAIDALPLPEAGKRTVHHDAKTTGLQIRVASGGAKTFCLYRRIKGGQPERVTLGRYPDMTIEQARRKASEINAAIEGGANPAEAKRAHKAEPTFADLFNEYIERHAKLKKRTWAEDVQRFQQYLEKPLGGKRLSTITRQDIAAVHAAITKAGHGATANRVLALVSSIFGRGIEFSIIETNPAKGIRRNTETSRERFLQSDELPRFFQALADEENDTMRDYFLLSLLTGARRANVLSMAWRDVSLERAEWRIGMTKNGTPQTVALSPEALTILLSRKETAMEGALFVFPGSGACGHLAEPKKGWKRVLARAGLDNLRIHDLRRTLGSWQAKTGASLAIIGKSLNHKNQATTAIYARLDLDPVRQSVNTATSAMLAAAGVKQSANVLPLRAAK
ncbi:MAG: tyrosine-type recombinase/integrase [Sulfuricella sp.]